MKDISYKLQVTPDGDFDLTESLFQNQEIIIQSDKGKVLNDLLLGVGITKHLNGPSTNLIQLNNEIKSECKKQNINIQSFQIVNGEIYIKSNEI